MADIILHHYPESPYAEKIRRILGFKKLAWRSVVIPMIMPKPDLTALTGGYRKTPVMQIGADVYCDTDLIARVIERRHPEPTLFPDGAESLALMVSPWQQELFMLAVQLVGLSANVFPAGFIEDRTTMIEGGIDLDRLLRELPARHDQLRAKLCLVEQRLTDGRPYLQGDRAGLLDFEVLHPVFILRNFKETAPVLEPFAHVRAWLERLDAFGHGTRTDIEAEEALRTARTSTSTTEKRQDPGDPNGRKPGDRVRVVHADFGRDPVVGELVASSAEEIAIARRDERAGDVVVHFPREHYLVLPA